MESKRGFRKSVFNCDENSQKRQKNTELDSKFQNFQSILSNDTK